MMSICIHRAGVVSVRRGWMGLINLGANLAFPGREHCVHMHMRYIPIVGLPTPFLDI